MLYWFVLSITILSTLYFVKVVQVIRCMIVRLCGYANNYIIEQNSHTVKMKFPSTAVRYLLFRDLMTLEYNESSQ